MNPFPHSNIKGEKPVDGTVFELPLFCKRHFNEKCKAHYKRVWDKDGFHVCPYGFTTHVESNAVNSCMKIKNHINRKALKRNSHKKDILANFEVSKYLSIKERAEFEVDSRPKKAGEIQLFSDELSKKEMLDITLHEIRKLNRNLKVQAEKLNNESQTDKVNKQLIRDRAYNIYSTSQLFTIRLNTYDFTSNPDLALSENFTNTNVYKKFEKAKHTLGILAQEKKLTINFSGKSNKAIEAFSIFELAPFILLENAVKYSPEQSIIECNFFENYEKLSYVEVKNDGPLPAKEELNFLTSKGYRSKFVLNKKEGSGIGLYLANIICNVHDIDLKIEIGNPKFSIDSIQYGSFCVKLSF